MITPRVSISSSGLFSSDTSVSWALKGLWEPHQLAVRAQGEGKALPKQFGSVSPGSAAACLTHSPAEGE